ncbi:MAG: helix-turn-helix transcriptional regulator [Oscillospiraceae bacterium]|nr:helix-turn-helix transcriptional regulator [Oscillospiraceae bacterium]
MEVNLLCDKLTQVLDIGDIGIAEKILIELKNAARVDDGIFLQFIMSKEAKLWELQNKPPSEIFPLIERAMAETFKNFDLSDLDYKVLILEETELVHTSARVHAKSGDVDTAINILEKMVSAMLKLPEADKDKEKQLTSILMSLSKLLLQIEEYDQAIEICDLGAKYSAKWKQGRLNPDFELTKAFALLGIDKADECRGLLQQAYFSYMLLGEINKAQNVLVVSKKDFGIEFELYGVDKMDISPQQRIPYSRGSAVKCNSFGAMVKALREKAKLTQPELCYGICSEPTLSRIEDDKFQTNFFTIEAIMQRLGRNVDLYKNFFLSKDEFLAMQLRDKINISIITMQHNEASRLTSELEENKITKKSNVLKQFLAMSKARLFYVAQSEPPKDYPDMLLESLKITCPQFSEQEIENCYFSNNEIALINLYAGYFIDSGDSARATEIYKRLRNTIERTYVDEVEKSRAYATILLNYSSALGRTGRRLENIAVIEEGEHFERSRGRLSELAGFAFNKGYNLLMLDRKEESIPYFAMAYYGTALFAQYGQELYLDIMRETAKKHFDIVFD